MFKVLKQKVNFVELNKVPRFEGVSYSHNEIEFFSKLEKKK